MATLPDVKIKTIVFRNNTTETLDGAPEIKHGGVLVIYTDSEVNGYAPGEWTSFKTVKEQHNDK